jgi:hypothetical protein
MRVAAKNVWGTQGVDGGYDQQRSDLWVLDMDTVAKELGMVLKNSRYYAKSIKLPALVVASESFQRDTRPYMMPATDEALTAVAINFIHSVPTVGRTFPPIHDLLTRWRSRVRMGRGGLSSEEATWISEANNYGAALTFRWDVPVYLLRGLRPDEVSDTALDTLPVSVAYTLKNMWLGSFGLSDLDTTATVQGLEVQASFFCEDILAIAPQVS